MEELRDINSIDRAIYESEKTDLQFSVLPP